MASSVVSELVLFIVSLLVAGMVAGGLYVVTQDISGGIITKGQDVAESLRTNFEIINDPENIPVSGSSYVFYIRNTGKDSFSFDPNSVVVMIDGSIIPPANLTFDPSGVLAPYEVGKIYVPTAFISSSGYHKITVVIETGKRKSLVFEVG
ncbi:MULTISPECIES: flagellar protein G [Thermococcus]|uniref:Flagellar protein G n=1 Tax=Thermococcus barossii TaxID=54077 RepID=A0A2Z2MDZ4_9EURY|nr:MULTISPECIES: flagellar protein G [Thermococcus]ASJ04850.1 flagellar protein G [Thermococcus barossii]NJE76915.1 flagellar protein G [Thermococcus sp. ES12]